MLVSIFRWSRTLLDLSAKNKLIVKPQMAFFDTNIVMHSMTIEIPNSNSRQFDFEGEDKQQNYFFVFGQFQLTIFIWGH